VDLNSAAIVALIVAALPLFIIATVAVVVVAVIILIVAFIELIERPPRYWVLALSVILDFVLLGPIAIVSFWVANREPTLWATARGPVFVFATILLAATGLQWAFCQYRDNHDRKDA